MTVKAPIKWPIERTVVVMSKDYVKRLYPGDVVRCIFCGREIVLSDKTVVEEPLKHGGEMQYVICPYRKCRKKVSVLAFFDNVLRRGTV